MHIRIAALAAVLLLGAGRVVNAADGLPGLKFEQQDWELYCDNTGTCRAAGYHPNGSAPVSVLLTRAAGPDTPVTAELMIGESDQLENLPQRFELAMRINGRTLGAVPGTSRATLSAAQRDALLAALAGKGKIEWHYKKLQLSLSDKGAAAVLRKMDEYQGRSGTRSALIDKGTAAQDKVRKAVAAPKMTPVAPVTAPAPRALTLATLNALRATTDAAQCPPLFDKSTGPRSFAVERLSASQVLVTLLCLERPHRNKAYWVVDETGAAAPVLVTAAGTGYGLGFIKSAQWGRSQEDCMQFQQWTWNGRQFVPTAWYWSGMCRNIASGGAWELTRLVVELPDPQ